MEKVWASPGITGRGANIWGPVDGGTEGPEQGAEARNAGAPRGVGSGRGAVAPPQYGGLWAICPQKNVQKINVPLNYITYINPAEKRVSDEGFEQVCELSSDKFQVCDQKSETWPEDK